MSAPALSKPELIPGIENQTLVQIVIVQDDPKLKPQILVYPQRCSDATVYLKKHGHPKVSPVKPEQVRWVVKGLRDGQELAIVPKDASDNTFESLDRIPYGCNSIVSTLPKKTPPHDRWDYSVRLYQKGILEPIAELDPGIEIKDDP